MEAVLDTAFPLAFRDQVLKFLFPLFPAPTSDSKSAHVYALTRILVTLNSPEMTINFLNSLVPNQRLLAYQFAFDLVEGGGQDFLEIIRKDLPEGSSVSLPSRAVVQLCIQRPLGDEAYLRPASQDPAWPGVDQAVPGVPQAQQ